MADLFQLDPARIDETASMDTIDAWDSANHISLVLALEDEFGISFDVSEIEAVTSFSDLVQTVASKT